MNIYSKILKENKDLLQRIDNRKVNSKYLSNEDVFLYTLEDMKLSDSIEIAKGLIVVHYNPDNLKIVGFTVPYVREFLKTFKEFEKKEVIQKASKSEFNLPPIRVASAAQVGLAYAF